MGDYCCGLVLLCEQEVTIARTGHGESFNSAGRLLARQFLTTWRCSFRIHVELISSTSSTLLYRILTIRVRVCILVHNTYFRLQPPYPCCENFRAIDRTTHYLKAVSSLECSPLTFLLRLPWDSVFARFCTEETLTHPAFVCSSSNDFQHR